MGLSLAVSKLPGTNHDYQPGDECLAGHFMHLFQSEDELRTEMTEAGAMIKDMGMARGYAVLLFDEAADTPSVA
jgi:hypothetical protein